MYFFKLFFMIGERLTYYIEKQGLTKTEFCKKFGFNYNSFVSTLADKLPLGMNVLKQVKEALPNLNTEWLLFGNGDIDIREDNHLNSLNEPATIYSKIEPNNFEQLNILLMSALKDKEKIINGLEFKITTLSKDLEKLYTEEIHVKSNVGKSYEIPADK